MQTGALLLALLLAASPALARDRGPDGRFERRSSENFVLYQDVGIDHRTGWRGSNQFEREVLISLEAAHDALRNLLGIEPRQRVYVTIYDPAVFEAQFAALSAFPAAGFYAGSIRIRGDVQFTAELARVLHHEYVHAALDAAAPSLVLPALVNEGLAEWFARRSLGLPILGAGELQMLSFAGRSGGWLPLQALLDPSFARLDSPTASLAYLESRAFVAYLVRHHGERALLEFWRVLVRTGQLEHAIGRAFDSDLAEIEARMLRELAG
jgi:hypothetical protein